MSSKEQLLEQPTFVRMVIELRSFWPEVDGGTDTRGLGGAHFAVANVDLPVTKKRSVLVQDSVGSVNISIVVSWWKVEPPTA